MTQRRRVLTALLYALLFVILNRALFGGWLPPIGPEGAWFYSGLAILLVSGALQEPFFTTPAHCVANAFALLLAAVAFPTSIDAPAAASSVEIGIGRTLIIAYSVALIAVGLLAVFTKDSTGRTGRVVSGFASRVSGSTGSAKVVFSVGYLTSVYATYRGDPFLTWVLLLAWLLVVVIRPLERLPDQTLRVFRLARYHVGTVTSVRHPGLVDVRVAAGEVLTPGSLVTDGKAVQLVTLDSTGGLAGGWALLGTLGATPAVGSLLQTAEPRQDRNSEIGPIEPGSTVESVLIRAPVNTPDIREGALVQLPIRGVDTVYQVLGATIRRETFDSGLQLRFIEIWARKIGAWDGESRKFVNVSWLPAAGELARLVPRTEAVFNSDSVGSLPDSDYPITLDANSLVTHNTAILGILGVGKTYLTFELIRRLLLSGTKAVVLDITGEYSGHFRELFPEAYENGVYEAVENATTNFHGEVSQHVHQGGSVNQFRISIQGVLRDFLNSDRPILVVNPERLRVTRQDSKPYQGQASMAPLTMVEVTRIVAEELLGLLQALPLATGARVSLVMEEAHSLVPEWNSTSYSGDQQASAGTAKAVLQGRKYGLGVVLITQRTANVTKTILNQCHTVFAMRSFDATGMEFLSNYIGAAYVGTLNTLEERHAVVFGRASSCPSPVIIRINDHQQMLDGFWEGAKTQVAIEPLGVP